MKIIKDCSHGDWKTNSIKPRRDFKSGEEVEVLEKFKNFDGRWVTVKGMDGVFIDVKEDNLI